MTEAKSLQELYLGGGHVAGARDLSAQAWRIVWLTPLAADPGFEPKTAALVAIRPFLDRLGDAGSIERICAQILDLANEKAA